MTSFITTYSLNLDNLKLKNKEVFQDWEDLICEHEGSFASDGQYMTFDCDGLEICVDFELSIFGSVHHDRGDYWTPPYTEVEITDLDININSLLVDDWDVEITDEMYKKLEKVIKSNL